MTRPWTLEGLAALYALSAGGSSLGSVAEALGRLKADCDLALCTMVGRTPEQALTVLGGKPVAVIPPFTSRLDRFLQENLP